MCDFQSSYYLRMGIYKQSLNNSYISYYPDQVCWLLSFSFSRSKEGATTTITKQLYYHILQAVNHCRCIICRYCYIKILSVNSESHYHNILYWMQQTRKDASTYDWNYIPYGLYFFTRDLVSHSSQVRARAIHNKYPTNFCFSTVSNHVSIQQYFKLFRFSHATSVEACYRVYFDDYYLS